MPEQPVPTASAAPSTGHRPVRATVLTITVLAALVSLIALVAILVEYFAHVAVWPPLMAIGLWGLPVAFIGLVIMLLIAVRDRRKADRAIAGA